MGKADVLWEETSKRTIGTAGVKVQASGERFEGVTLGRCYAQQGAGGNLQRPVDQGYDRRRQEGIGSAHEPVGAMKKGGTPFEETHQVSLQVGNTGRRQRCSGYLVVPRWFPGHRAGSQPTFEAGTRL